MHDTLSLLPTPLGVVITTSRAGDRYRRPVVRDSACRLAALVSVLGLTACTGVSTLPELPTAAAMIEQLPKLAVAMPQLPATEPSTITAGSTEVYTRIARGAMSCWFGARGRLTASYIYHADAAPTLNGGGAEIVIHERAIDQPKPWGYKAFRVTLVETTGFDGSPGGGGTQISVDNLRMPDADALEMRADVYRWATGTDGCGNSAAAQPAALATAPKPAPAVTSKVAKAALAAKNSPARASRDAQAVAAKAPAASNASALQPSASVPSPPEAALPLGDAPAVTTQP